MTPPQNLSSSIPTLLFSKRGFASSEEKEVELAVISNAFGGLHLSGEDAKKFRNQTRARTKSPAAKAAARSGMAAAKALIENGYVTVAK